MMANTKVAWFGLGMMGVPMVSNLLRAGIAVSGFDLKADAAPALNGQTGYTRAATAAAAIDGAKVVVLMLPDSRIVDALLWGAAKLADALAAGTVLIDMGSSNPNNSKANAEKLAAKGVVFLDAPVSGGVKRAIDGSLTIMVGGAAEALETSRPVLQAMGKAIIRVGDAGAGHAVKSLNNYVSAAGLIAVSEALVAAQRFGIDTHLVNQVFNASSAKNNTTEQKVEPAILTGKYNTGFALALMTKDVQTAAEFIEGMGMTDAFVRHVVELSKKASTSLGPGADQTAIHAYIAKPN